MRNLCGVFQILALALTVLTAGQAFGKPRNCGIKPNEYVYVTRAYQSPSYTLRSTSHRHDVGLALVKETFGDCTSGHATISVGGTTISAPMSSILRSSTCEYGTGRASSSALMDTTVGTTAMKLELGEGSIAQMFGDCKTGVTLFRSDQKPFVDLIVDTATLRPVTGHPSETAQARPISR